MHIWRLIAHHNEPDQAIDWFKRTSLIAIGWGRIGDLRKSHTESAQEISKLIYNKDRKDGNATHGGLSLIRFYRQMQPGDLVIVGDGRRRRIVMEVTGDYEWSSDPSPDWLDDYYHRRQAKYSVAHDHDALWRQCHGKEAAGESKRWALFRMRQ